MVRATCNTERVRVRNMPFDIRQFNKRVLLIGAGFSRNWGGRLAREMWEEIFSHAAIQFRPALRMLLLRTPFFENALAEITDPKAYDEQDRAAMKLAIEEAFERMDAEHAAQLSNVSPKIDPGTLRQLFAWFYSSQHGVGYIFSLNQDLLMERLSGFRVDVGAARSPIFPGFVNAPLALPGFHHSPVSPPAMSDRRLAGHLNYIKLHGSFRWPLTDGSPGMVLGGGKEIAIGQSPLLSWYHQLFNQILCSGDVRLLVIGYSFQDDHINRIIWTATQSFGARIFIWDTTNPLRLLEKVRIAEPAFSQRTIDLRPYLCGAASRTLGEVFPANGHTTAEYKRIEASFLR
jgi:hypothetical protein